LGLELGKSRGYLPHRKGRLAEIKTITVKGHCHEFYPTLGFLYQSTWHDMVAIVLILPLYLVKKRFSAVLMIMTLQK
jgi:hypothetical protein